MQYTEVGMTWSRSVFIAVAVFALYPKIWLFGGTNLIAFWNTPQI